MRPRGSQIEAPATEGGQPPDLPGDARGPGVTGLRATSPPPRLAPAMPAARTVLITGRSTGIGRATAARPAGRGWAGKATARRTEPTAAPEGRGCRILALDVSDEGSMRAAVER